MKGKQIAGAILLRLSVYIKAFIVNVPGLCGVDEKVCNRKNLSITIYFSLEDNQMLQYRKTRGW